VQASKQRNEAAEDKRSRREKTRSQSQGEPRPNRLVSTNSPILIAGSAEGRRQRKVVSSSPHSVRQQIIFRSFFLKYDALSAATRDTRTPHHVIRTGMARCPTALANRTQSISVIRDYFEIRRKHTQADQWPSRPAADSAGYATSLCLFASEKATPPHPPAQRSRKSASIPFHPPALRPSRFRNLCSSTLTHALCHTEVISACVSLTPPPAPMHACQEQNSHTAASVWNGAALSALQQGTSVLPL